MKTRSLFTTGMFILFFSLATTAQITGNENNSAENKSYNTEFNFGVADLFSKPYFIYYDSYNTFPYVQVLSMPGPSAVVGMKFHNRAGALRLSSKFGYQKQHMNDPDDPDFDYSDAKIINTWLYAGYEWKNEINKTTLFYGFDLGYGLIHYKGYDYDYGDIIENKASQNNFSISPLLGFNYSVSPRVSIGTEMKLNFVTYIAKEKYRSEESLGNGNYDTTIFESKETGTYINFGPLGYLLLSIYF